MNAYERGDEEPLENEYEGELQPLVDWVPAREDATGDEEEELESADLPLGVNEPEVTAAGERRGESLAERVRREEPEHDPVAPDLGVLVSDDDDLAEDPSATGAHFGTPLGLAPEDRAMHEEEEPGS